MTVEAQQEPESMQEAEGEASSTQMPREDEPIAEDKGASFTGEDVHRSFFAAPVKFAIHAVFYCAGRVADKMVSLYSGAFKLDREYVADFNKSSGVAHARRGHWGKAISHLEKALAVAPGDVDTRMLLVEACGAIHDYEKAYQHLEKVLEASPNSAQAVRALGFLYSRQRNYERAIEYLERAVELDPDHVQAHYRLGTAYDNQKKYDQAVESFRKATRLDPRFAKAHQALGFTYESMGDRESAVECFKKALELE